MWSVRSKGWSNKKSLLVFCFLEIISESYEKKVKKEFEDQRIKTALLEHKIIPDVIEKPDTPIPRHILKVAYGKKSVDLGNEFFSLEIENKPTSFHWPTQPGAKYALIAIGPDMPTVKSPDERHWLHWAVGNIRGCSVSKATEITPYDGLNLGYELGPHRIVYLLYKQPTDAELYFLETEFTSRMDFFRRAFYNPQIFEMRYNLSGPLAINFLIGKWENETPNISSIYTDD